MSIQLIPCVMPFEFFHNRFVASSQRPFKPRGLAIWGAPNGAELRQALVGATMQLVASWGGIPCKFFSYGDSYEQIAKLVADGKEPPAWCAWDIVHVGMTVQLYIEHNGRALGPNDGVEVVMWGHSITHMGGPRLGDIL